MAIKPNKILLGSALVGLMIAGPGLSVTAGKFFQTAELNVGYRVAQAEEKKDEAKKDEAKPEEKAEEKKDEKKEEEKKDDKKADKGAAGKCGAGACG